MNAIEIRPPQETDLPVGVKPASTMDMISAAVMRGAPIEMVEKLLALHERYEASQAKRAFNAAMADAKKEIPVITKNRHVGYNSKDPEKSSTNYDHEDLAEIARTVDPILGRHGLSYRFRSKQEGHQIYITCIISHKDGHFEENTLGSGPDATGKKNTHQAIASATTYLSRYTLRLALGLSASKDDDGAKADGEPEKISDEQLNELIKLADQAGANKIAFCNFMKVDSFAAIPPSKFAQAKKELQNKLEANRRKAAAAKAVVHA